MSGLEAFLLGILQALTEFLPVSSSGHIELGKAFMDVKGADNKTFSVVVHVATVLSTLIVFRKDVGNILGDVFRFRNTPNSQFFLLLVVSSIPVALIGVLLKDELDVLFTGDLVLVGSMLLLTAGLLLLTKWMPTQDRPVTLRRSILIGFAQAVAILPGISRSGATITTALGLGVSREQAARFSFLMAVIPILGAGALEAKDLVAEPELIQLSLQALLIGGITALVVGTVAYAGALGLTALLIGLLG